MTGEERREPRIKVHASADDATVGYVYRESFTREGRALRFLGSVKAVNDRYYPRREHERATHWYSTLTAAVKALLAPELAEGGHPVAPPTQVTTGNAAPSSMSDVFASYRDSWR